MSWNKLTLAAICCHAILSISAAQAVQAAEPRNPPPLLYQCPAQLQLDDHSYALSGANVFDGPIEDRVALLPEPAPDVPKRSIWKHEADQRTLHVKCRYQGVAHYIVLEAKNARQCTAHTANSVVRVECE